MRLRPYVHSRDFDAIKGWVADERTNAMWSAKHAPFPMEKDAFSDFLTAMYDKHGDCPFVAVTDEGEIVGFICTSINMDSNEAMLAFVIVDPAQRGKGYGKEMIELAARYCLGTVRTALEHTWAITRGRSVTSVRAAERRSMTGLVDSKPRARGMS